MARVKQPRREVHTISNDRQFLECGNSLPLFLAIEDRLLSSQRGSDFDYAANQKPLRGDTKAVINDRTPKGESEFSSRPIP